MYDPIHAKPNLNGNTREDFESAYMALTAAKDAIDLAASELLGNVAHGRNYQHLESPDDHLIADRRFIHEKCRDAQALLGILQSSLVDALENAV
jgi:hypothetical protein